VAAHARESRHLDNEASHRTGSPQQSTSCCIIWLHRVICRLN